ncbi:putative signal transducing protein [Zhongshania aliphaticivorans]|uniref:putative signal transducing protein n=1 Tax=Zhongshania aliphaticivorans TaxID=1470434 RepID=UPI0039C8FEE5
MKKIFTDPNLSLVANAANVLAAAGLTTELRNAYAGGASGGLAFTDVWPELWVATDSVAAAEALLADLSKDDDREWQCPSCKEHNGVSFKLCWQCGSPQS